MDKDRTILNFLRFKSIYLFNFVIIIVDSNLCMLHTIVHDNYDFIFQQYTILIILYLATSILSSKHINCIWTCSINWSCIHGILVHGIDFDIHVHVSVWNQWRTKSMGVSTECDSEFVWASIVNKSISPTWRPFEIEW